MNLVTPFLRELVGRLGIIPADKVYYTIVYYTYYNYNTITYYTILRLYYTIL